MLQICATIPIPTFNSLYDQALPAMTFPPSGFSVPLLPAIPNPIYVGFGCTNLEIVQILAQLQSYQLLTTFLSFIQPLVDFLGIAIDSILPNIPGTNLTLLDLLALDPTKIYEALAAIPLSVLQTFSGVPNPLKYAVAAPGFELTLAIQGVVNGYMNSLIGVVVSLISSVINNLDIDNMTTPPPVPTMDAILALIIPAGLTIEQIVARLQQIPLNSLLALSVFPPFPPLPLLAVPFIPSVNMPEIEFHMAVELLYTNYVMYPMTLILSFIETVLSQYLGFSFPTVCVSI